MTHRWESLGGFCMRCHLAYTQVWQDPRLAECNPDVVVGMAARRPRGEVPLVLGTSPFEQPSVVVEKFDGSRVTITTDEASMSQYEFLQLGEGKEDCLHCQIASLVGMLINGRLMSGEATTIVQLRDALVMLVGEVDAMLEKDHRIGTSRLSSPECSYSVPGGVWKPAGYIRFVGGPASVMPGACLLLAGFQPPTPSASRREKRHAGRT